MKTPSLRPFIFVFFCFCSFGIHACSRGMLELQPWSFVEKKEKGEKRSAGCWLLPDRPFSQFQSLKICRSMYVSEVHKNCLSRDFEALKLWKVRSGMDLKYLNRSHLSLHLLFFFLLLGGGHSLRLAYLGSSWPNIWMVQKLNIRQSRPLNCKEFNDHRIFWNCEMFSRVVSRKKSDDANF